MRLFFAVGFDESMKNAIATAIDGIGLGNPPWRWVARDNFHVTMKFLGDTPEDRLATLAMSAAGAFKSGGMAPFMITLGGMGGFPNLRRPRVLFYNVTKGCDNLAALAKRLDAEGANGLVLFNRFYQPDINLETLEVNPNILLSTPMAMRVPLRWVAILHGRIQASIAATSGIHRATDALKMLMAPS